MRDVVKGVCEQENFRHQTIEGETVQEGNSTYIILRCTGCDRVRGKRLVRKATS